MIGLLRSNTIFQWNEEAQQAFDALKGSLTSAPILALPNFDQDLLVETYGFGTGIGVVLLQNDHVTAYISKMSHPHHQLLSAYEKDMFAILFAVKSGRNI